MEALAFIGGMAVGAIVAIFTVWRIDKRRKQTAFVKSSRPEPKAATVFIQKTAGGETGKIARVRPVHIRSRRNNNPER